MSVRVLIVRPDGAMAFMRAEQGNKAAERQQAEAFLSGTSHPGDVQIEFHNLSAADMEHMLIRLHHYRAEIRRTPSGDTELVSIVAYPVDASDQPQVRRLPIAIQGGAKLIGVHR